MTPFPGSLNPAQVPMRMHRVKDATAADAAFTPDSLSGFMLDLDADSGDLLQSAGGAAADADGDPVGLWPDQSGNSNDASQSTTAAKPTLKTGIVNGKPVLRFATDDFLSLGDVELHDNTEGITVFVVGTGNTNDCYIGKYDSGSDHRQWMLRDDGWYVQENAASFDSNTNALYSSEPTSMAILTSDWRGGSTAARAWINGGSQATALTAVTDITGTVEPVLIGVEGNTARNNFLTGDITRILIYNRSLSDTERQQVEQYLADAYGITLA